MDFVKAHGLGNDFVIADGRNGAYTDTDLCALARRVCHRRTGVGADGLIFVRESSTEDIRMQLFNSDGSEAEMCGNGIRCFAKYVFDKGIIRNEKFVIETLAGPQRIELAVKDGKTASVRVNMGSPFREKRDIPMTGEGECRLEKINALGREFTFSAILLGVPHAAVFVDEIPENEELCRYGRAIETAPVFPRRANVNFTRVIDPENIEVRTWERGCGATYACGTGSSSAAVCSAIAGKTGRHVFVHLALGTLEILWADDGNVYMTGPAEFAFEGDMED